MQKSGDKLQKKKSNHFMQMVHGIWFLCQKAERLLDQDGCSESKGMLMDLWKDTKQDLLLKAICNALEWIIQKSFLPLSEWHQLEPLLPWLQNTSICCIPLTSSLLEPVPPRVQPPSFRFSKSFRSY